MSLRKRVRGGPVGTLDQSYLFLFSKRFKVLQITTGPLAKRLMLYPVSFSFCRISAGGVGNHAQL